MIFEIIASNDMFAIISLLAMITKSLLTPICPLTQQVFKLKESKTSDVWVKKIIADDTYTYEDCIKYPQVMTHHIMSEMRKGDANGYPIVDASKGNVPPDGTRVYDASITVTTFKSHMTKPHPEMPFLRAAPLNDALEKVRNEGHAPVQVFLPILLLITSTLCLFALL